MLWFHFCSHPKGQGRGSIERLHKYETVAFAHILICMNPHLGVWISAWKVNENTFWKQRDENTRSRCQNFLFLLILALGFELHVHIHLNSITYTRTVFPSFSLLPILHLISCLVSWLSLLFQTFLYYSWNRNNICSPKNTTLHPQNLPYPAIC